MVYKLLKWQTCKCQRAQLCCLDIRVEVLNLNFKGEGQNLNTLVSTDKVK